MKFVICLIFFFSLICACNNKKTDANSQLKFDKVKWQIKEDADFPYRDEMLDDLINNVTLKGLKIDSVIALLGQPDHIDNGHLFYPISQKRIGGFPLSTKTFVIKLTKDSTVEWRKIHGG